MKAYHFRWYTFLFFLDLFDDAEARLRDGCREISLSFLVFGAVVSCWLQKDTNIDSIYFRKLLQREGSSTARIITRIYGCVWHFRTLQTAVTGSLSTPILVSNKGQFRAILCNIACEWVSFFFLHSYNPLSHSHMKIATPVRFLVPICPLTTRAAVPVWLY